MAGFWESLLPGGLGAYGYASVMGDLDNQRTNTKNTLADLTSQAKTNTSFTPWSVTSNLGTSSGDSTGVSFDPSESQQSLQNQLFTGAGGMFSNAAMDPAAREQSVYDRIRAVQTPGEERQKQMLDQRLFSQGRLDVASNQGGGGSPEQMAYYAAQNEAKNRAALMALQQGQQEMQNYSNVGTQMMNQGYMPQKHMMELGGYGLNNSQLNQTGQHLGANLMAQLGLGGLTADTNYSNIKGNAFGNMITAMMPVATQAGAGLDSASANAGGFWNMLANQAQDLF